MQFNNLVASKFEGQMWQLPNVVYARHLVLSPAMQVSQKDVLSELDQLNYRKVAQPTKSGEYSISGQTIRLIRRPFVFLKVSNLRSRQAFDLMANALLRSPMKP